MVTGVKKQSIADRLRSRVARTFGPDDKDKELMMRMVQKMIRPYILDALENCKLSPDDLILMEFVHEELLDMFWKMKDEDAQVSMALIPIMAWLKKADRAQSAARPKSG